MEQYNEQEYTAKLISAGASLEDAQQIARKYAEVARSSAAQPKPKLVSQAAKATPAKSTVKTTDEPDAAELDAAPENSKPKAKAKPLTKKDRELIEAKIAIESEAPGGDDLTFMHSIMCQVGLPRSKVEGLEFERTCGGAGLYIRAGKLWDGQKFVQQPVPYGPMPRLVMAYLNTAALRNRSAAVEVGDSASEFLRRLGKESTGGRNGSYTSFRKQILALSACSVTLGYTAGGRAITYDGKPIQQFEAWLTNNDDQPTLWPGVITFSQEYYQTLTAHAVPLDLRAMNALTGSALAMDIYAMLADRLHRISGRPLILHWKNLRNQFGQEYQGKDPDKDFKDAFLPQLKKVLAVYPRAKVKQVKGGVLMMPSPPPIPYKD